MRTYDIKPRAAKLGGGWKLTMYQDGVEAGGGVFPPGPDSYEDAEDEGKSWVGPDLEQSDTDQD